MPISVTPVAVQAGREQDAQAVVARSVLNNGQNLQVGAVICQLPVPQVQV